jgi:chloramphenicol 3-O-phosphotransferase
MKLKASEAAEITAAKAGPVIEKALLSIYEKIKEAADNGRNWIVIYPPNVAEASNAIVRHLKADGYFVSTLHTSDIRVGW